MNDILLQLKNLCTAYPTSRSPVIAVNRVNLTVHTAEIMGLVGESGCGKSAMLLSILRLIPRPGRIVDGDILGDILFDGRSLLKLTADQMRAIRGKDIAMIFQDLFSTLNPVFPIGEQIRESLRLHNIVPARGPLERFGWPLDRMRRAQERQRVLQVMEEVGISSAMDRYAAYPHQFSGGMQQRALIAIALACNPRLLLADEPTTALDVTIQAQILDLLQRIHRDHGTAIILVTHDLGVAAEFCHSIAVMYAGQIVERGTTDQVIENPHHPYTQGLLACRPKLDARHPIRPIPGEVPDLVDLPAGCSFYPRCAYARDECLGEDIVLTEVGDGHYARCIRPAGYVRRPDRGERLGVTA
ncbi:MAG: ABC transporter ATP-binding protein [Anaerolineae bacterium]